MAETKKRPSSPPFDVQSVNPRYRGAKMSEVVRVLLRPKNAAARATMDRLHGRSVTEERK